MRNIKKTFKLLIIICIFFINHNVYARDFSLKELIPVNEEANIFTDNFAYTGIKFETGSDNKANSVLRFKAISNNTDKRKIPSFNILLFDGAMKNIGYITYCASKDFGSDNSNVYISGKGSIPFKINVSSRYFGAGQKDYKGIVHEPGEILYYAFQDDNKYCQIGGYTKYVGLTLEEINGGQVNVKDKKIYEKIKLSELIMYLPYFLMGFVAFIVYGLFLNALHKRMNARTSILSYLPMTNLYIAVKLAFGKMIAWIFYLLCIVSFFIASSSGSMLFTYLLCIFVCFVTIIDIIKLLTKKYDLLIIGGKINNTENFDTNFATNSGSRFIDEEVEENNSNNKPVTTNEFLDSINNGVNDKQNFSESVVDSNDLVDISYESDAPISEDGFTSASNDFSVNFTTVNDMGNINNVNATNNVNDFNSINYTNDVNNAYNVNDVNNTMIQGIPEMNNLIPTSNVAQNPDMSQSNNNVNLNNTNNTQIPRLSEDDSGESELSNFFR